jgi:hypothetical protein
MGRMTVATTILELLERRTIGVRNQTRKGDLDQTHEGVRDLVIRGNPLAGADASQKTRERRGIQSAVGQFLYT